MAIFTRYFFFPHFWLLENSKITWFLNFANKKKGCRCSSWNSAHRSSRSLSLSRAAAPTRLPLPLLLLFFCSSWWKRREKNHDNGKDPALFSNTLATLLLLLCFSNSLLSFSVVVVFLLLFWSWLLDSKEVSAVCFDLDFWTRNWFDFQNFLFYEHSRFLLLFLFSFPPPTFRHVPF